MMGAPGFGPPQPQTLQTEALKSIDSRKYPFVNKDFVKNIAWLNQSVDALATFTQRLQQGVDQAGADPISQLSSIFADLFILFGGGEPTGVDVGDLKYIFQGIGALLGITPDTPFPLNLFEAAGHMLTNFMIPLPQFTDVIFASIEAWAEQLGFSDDASDAIQEFDDAVIKLYQDWSDVTGEIGDLIDSFFRKVLGFGSGTGSTGPGIWDELSGLIHDFLEGPHQGLLTVISAIVVILFKGLTWLVTMVDPKTYLKSTGLDFFGPELAPNISNSTIDWNVGSSVSAQWVYDNTVSYDDRGSFKTNGTGVGKRLLTQATHDCMPDQTFQLSAQMRWSDVPADVNTFGPCIVFFSERNEVVQYNIDMPAGHGASGGFTLVSQDFVVPQNVDGFKFGCQCLSNLNSGSVWVSKLSCLKQSSMSDSLGNVFGSFLPFNLFDDLLSGDLLGSFGPVNQWFQDMLSLMGRPAGMGTGAPEVTDDITQIPLLGPVLRYLLDLPGELWNEAMGFVQNLLAGNVGGAAGNVVNFILTILGLGNKQGGAIGTAGDVGSWITGIFDNPFGKSTGSILDAGTKLAAKSSSSDVSGLLGSSSVLSLAGDVYNLFANPTGASAGSKSPLTIGQPGSFTQNIWGGIWDTINCYGLTGQGFAAGQQWGGLFDNPTGSAKGSLLDQAISRVTGLGDSSTVGKVASAAMTLAPLVNSMSPSAAATEHPAGWQWWMDFWPPWIVENTGETVSQRWDWYLERGYWPFPPFPFVLFATHWDTPGGVNPFSSGEGISQMLTGLFGNPTGASAGSLSSQVVSAAATLAAPVISSASPLGSVPQMAAGLLGNPTGSSAGSLTDQIVSAVTSYINDPQAFSSRGLTGEAASIVANLVGVLGNPTGMSGTPLGLGVDVYHTLMDNGGRGLTIVTQMVVEVASANWGGLVGTFLFGGGLVIASELMAEGVNIVNFFGSPFSGSNTLANLTGSGTTATLGLGNTEYTTGGILGSATNAAFDFMGYLGNPTNLGIPELATVAGVPDAPVLTPIKSVVNDYLGGVVNILNNNQPDPSANIDVNNALAALQNVTTSTTAVDAHQLDTLHPSTSSNLIPDPNLVTNSVDGQGLWLYDGPDANPSAIRTTRTGVITVFVVWGTGLVTAALGNVDLTDPKVFVEFFSQAQPDLHITRPLDMTYYEVVNVQYDAALFGMNASVLKGTTTLINLINATPGAFMLMGASQGGGVIANVYDELRTGSLQSRNDDFILGISLVSTRRQMGSSFLNVPAFCPSGRGLIEPNLEGTVGDPRWWEWSPGQGTYPTPDGLLTIGQSDVVSCLDDSDVSHWVRRIAGLFGAQPANVDTLSFMDFLSIPLHFMTVIDAALELYNGLLGSATAAHQDTYFKIQPMMASGINPADNRIFWQIMLDYLNSLGPEIITPVAVGDLYELEGLPLAVNPNQSVTFGASTQWSNVDATGEAINVGVNIYDANDNYVDTLVTSDTQIIDPAPSLDWEPLITQVNVPANAAKARLVFKVMPEVLRSKGVVWFKKPILKAANRIDGSQIDVTSIPVIPPTNIGGTQGIPDLAETVRHMLDGWANALGTDVVTDSPFSRVFELVQETATNAQKGVDLATQLAEKLAPELLSRLTTKSFPDPGIAYFDLPFWVTSGTKLYLTVCGAGGGATGGNWFETIDTANAGGLAGAWNGVEVTYGVEIPLGQTQLKVYTGSGGISGSRKPGNPFYPQATAGETTTISLMDGTILVSGVGGMPYGYFYEKDGLTSWSKGQGSGNYVLPSRPGKTYFGGADVDSNNPGSSPGGGAGAFFPVPAGDGAPGIAYCTASQAIL